MDSIHFWQFCAGLGVFLYGMVHLEQGLTGLGSDAFTDFLRNQTKSPWRGVIGGVLATACLQSSSVVGLIVLAFVGAGILQFRQALGVMLGANVGSTLTGWIVTFIGFKLNLDSLSLPLLAVGSMMIVYFKPATGRYLTGSLLLGFGFLLFGLSNMKESAETFVSLDVVDLLAYPPFVFLVIAALFTAIIHSSAATMMIVLSALNSGIIDLNTAAVLAIGADLGTTSTLLLGGLRGSADKKRVAVAHLFFNVITNSIALVFLMPLLWLINAAGIADPLYALVAFHTAFNVIGVFLFLPFIDSAATKLESMFRKPSAIATAFIPGLPVTISKDVIDAAILAVENETQRLLFKVLLLQARTFKIEEVSILTPALKLHYRIDGSEHRFTYEESYTELKEIEGELMSYIYNLQNNTSYPQESERLSEQHHAIHLMVYAAKTIKDIRHDLVDIRHTQHLPVELDQNLLAKTVRHFCHQCIHLNDIDNVTVYKESWIELQEWVTHEYEQRKQALIASARSSAMSDIHLSTLLHINKAILLAHNALLEAVQIKQV